MASKKDEARIKFIAETEEFSAGIKSCEKDLGGMRSELNLNKQQLKGNADSVDLLKERQSLLSTELEKSKEKVELTSQKLDKAKEVWGENSEEVQKLTKDLNAAKTQEAAIQNEIDSTNKQLKDHKNSFQTAGESVEKFGGKVEKAGKGLSVISAGVVAAGTAAVASFNAVDEGSDNVIAATGATGEAAAELDDIYKQVAGSVVGDFGDIGKAVGDVSTRFEFTGDTLKSASTDFLHFASVNNTDVSTAVQKVSRYMGDASIPASEYKSVLDTLTKASQVSGISVDDLAESCTKFGAPMRALGFDTNESVAIFSQWEKAGVNTDTAFSGMKKAISNWASQGKDAREEFKTTLDAIAAAPDIASATSMAIDTFGAKAGPDLADAIQCGRFEYQDMLDVLQGSDGTLDTTFGNMEDGTDKITLAMQNAKLALSDVGETIGNSAAPIVDVFTQKMQSLSAWWQGLSPQAQDTILKVAGIVAVAGPLVLIVGKLITGIGGMITAVGTIKKAVGAMTIVQNGLNLSFLACPITWIVLGIAALVAAFVILWNKCESFRNFWIGLWDGIKQKVANAKDFIGGIFNSIGAFFRGEWSLPRIKMPHFSVSPSGWHIGDLLKGSIPRLGIQWYAKGGVMTSPVIFGSNGGSLMGGGEDGPEAIAPISTLKSYIEEALGAALDRQSGVDYDRIESICKTIIAGCSPTIQVSDRELGRIIREVL